MSPIQYMQHSQQQQNPENGDLGAEAGNHGRINRSQLFILEVLRNVEA